MKRPTAAIATMVLVLSGCGGGGTDSGGGTGGTPATVKDFAIALDPSSVPAGDLTFDIHNDGPSLHEFVVFRTDLPEAELPTDGATVSEDALDLVDEAEDIAPGSTVSLALTLEAGSYVVICNLPGHYGQGMHAALTVT